MLAVMAVLVMDLLPQMAVVVEVERQDPVDLAKLEAAVCPVQQVAVEVVQVVDLLQLVIRPVVMVLKGVVVVHLAPMARPVLSVVAVAGVRVVRAVTEGTVGNGVVLMAAAAEEEDLQMPAVQEERAVNMAAAVAADQPVQPLPVEEGVV